MSAEVFVSLSGTEAELRRLSAEEYLRAKVEARELEAEYGSDEETRMLLLAACLTVRGAYDGEKRLFASPSEALTALSAKELMAVAEEYLPQEIKKAESAEAAYPANSPAAAPEDVRGSRDITGKAPAEMMPDMSVRDNGRGEMPYATFRREPRSRAVSVLYGNSTDSEEPVSDTPHAETPDMDAVSDFFERDARRFPGGFEIF